MRSCWIEERKWKLIGTVNKSKWAECVFIVTLFCGGLLGWQRVLSYNGFRNGTDIVICSVSRWVWESSYDMTLFNEIYFIALTCRDVKWTALSAELCPHYLKSSERGQLCSLIRKITMIKRWHSTIDHLNFNNKTLWILPVK